MISNVRFGNQVLSPLIKDGDVDIMLVFEKLEAALWIHYPKIEGLAIINNQAIPTPLISSGRDSDPPDTEINTLLRQRKIKYFFVNAFDEARKMGHVRIMNIYLLGCLSAFMPEIKTEIWENIIRRHLPPRTHLLNLKRFVSGKRSMGNARS